MFKLTALLLFLLLASTQNAAANPAHDSLMAMPERDRQEFMKRFLSAGGEKCQRVTKTFYQGSGKNGDAFWNVACAGGDAYVVEVSNNATGSTKIISCSLMRAINAGTCFTKFKGR